MTKTNVDIWRWRWRAVAAAFLLLAAAGPAAAACPALLDHRIPRLQDEQVQDLCQYAGRVVVVVNTASQCGYTSQYRGLEALNTRYRSRGLVVLGFPSNDFGQQEPGSNQDVAAFCENSFGVRFPMFVKSRVRGADAHALYAELGRRSGQSPRWNFHKYVIGRDGRTVRSFASAVEPLDADFVAVIESLLDAR